MIDFKKVTTSLFFNSIDNTFYIQVGENLLFRIRDKIATAIQSKEQLNILHVSDMKEMQTKANEKSE
jgi:hypothetical protein